MDEKVPRNAPISDTAPVSLMLGAYALESLLKSVLVSKHTKVKGRNFNSRQISEFLEKIHDLDKLAVQADIRLTKADRKILAALSQYAIWAGRYPVPVKADGYVAPAMLESAWLQTSGGSHPIWSKYILLHQKISKLVTRKLYPSLRVQKTE